MAELKTYIQETLGTDIFPEKLRETEKTNLPYYVREAFLLYWARLLERPVLLAEITHDLTTGQIEKQLGLISDAFKTKVVLLADAMSSLERKRLAAKRVNFIVPGKQMYLPDFMIDFRETFIKKTEPGNTLIPTAQYFLLYHILRKTGELEKEPLKKIAEKLHYTPMAITKAVKQLEKLNLCHTEGSKEKHIRFEYNTQELWEKALPFMTSPVLKQVYTDELPPTAILRAVGKIRLYKANASALPEYSSIAETRQVYFAIENKEFYALQKKKQWKNLNEREGEICLEVWKYNPVPLAKGNCVDPLSLYLSLKNTNDERTQMALDSIMTKYALGSLKFE